MEIMGLPGYHGRRQGIVVGQRDRTKGQTLRGAGQGPTRGQTLCVTFRRGVRRALNARGSMANTGRHGQWRG